MENFGQYRQRINDKELRDVYELLGQKQSPGIDDYLAFINELATQAQGNPLSETAIDCTIRTLLKLWEQLSETGADVRARLLLPTETNQLLPAAQVLLPDAPWRLEGLRRSSLAQLLHPKIYECCSAIAKYAGSPSLAKDIVEEYQNFQQNQYPAAQKLCDEWQQQLSCPEFQLGLSRLILDEQDMLPEQLPDLSWLNRIKIYPANTICTNLYWNGKLIAEAVPGDYYFSDHHKTFYIRFDHEDSEVIPGYLAACLNYQLGEAFVLKMHLGILEDLLDITPTRIANILDKKRIRTLLSSFIAVELAEVSEVAESSSIFTWDEINDSTDDDLVEIQNYQRLTTTQPIAIAQTTSNSHWDTQPQQEIQPILASDRPQINHDSPLSNLSAAEDTWEDIPESIPSISPTPEPVSYRRTPRHRHILGEPPTRGDSTSQQSASTRVSGSFRSRLKSSVPGHKITLRAQTTHRQYATGASRFSHEEQKPRLITYVAPQSTDHLQEHDRQLIEQAGMRRVLAYEQLQGRIVKDMNEVCPNHPGYDIESVDGHGNRRYIEVKSKRGVWDDLGVKMTQTQFNTAMDRQNDFWLYVVEQAENDQAFRIYMIQNPAGRVNEFLYDNGWSAMADETYSTQRA
jgi:hypothetical protein